MKTSELTGAALDWAVAKCEGRSIDYDGIAYWVDDAHGCAIIGPGWKVAGKPCGYSPSSNWSQGGPIIERMGIELHNAADGSEDWVAHGALQVYAFGPTPLIAAMRCYCISCLGDEVDIPEELK